MDSIFEHDKPRLSAGDIFRNIWTAPAGVFRYLEDQQRGKAAFWLILLLGVIRAINSHYAFLCIRDGRAEFILLMILPATLMIALNFLLFSLLLSLAGRMMGTRRTARSFWPMLGYATIPAITGTLISRLMVLALTLPDPDSNFEAFSDVYKVARLIWLLSELWSLILFVVGIRQLMRLTFVKAIVTVVVAAGLAIIPHFLLQQALIRHLLR